MKGTEENRESSVRKIARLIKYNKIFFIIILIIIAHLVIAIVGSKGLITRLKLQSEKDNLEEDLKREQMKSEELKKEIDELNNSDKKIEKVAREKYGMTKPGEKIYKLEIDSAKK